MRRWAPILAVVGLLIATGGGLAAEITDAAGGRLVGARPPRHVICSGPGCLRLLVYLQAQDLVAAADDIEQKRSQFDARPYALANPQFRNLPLFGEFRGFDNPELILALNPAPEVIFKTYPGLGHDPVKLQHKTGIPVIVLDYGDFGSKRPNLYHSLRIMAQVIGRSQRAEAVIRFWDETIADLATRTRDIPPGERKRCFVGGIALKGPHGFQSTEPDYPPFGFVNALNAAQDPGRSSGAVSVAKEKIVEWNPDILFLDLATLQMGQKAGGRFELETDPAYQTLSAVQKGEVYGLLPYSWYTQNFGSILANAYFIGKLLYPQRFGDVDPARKADEIYTFMVGKPVFGTMNQAFQGLVYRKIPLN